jgi:pyruvate, water dikinase
MDIEWAKDGVDGLLYIVQSRPETVSSQRSVSTLDSYVLDGDGDVLTTGRSVGERSPRARSAASTMWRSQGEFHPGEVLAADTTTPDWEPVMKTAAAIVTNRGGRTCHAAIIARELGVPAVVGTTDATTAIPDGATVTVRCAGNDVGRVLRGAVSFHVEHLAVAQLPRPATQVMVNLGDPDRAFATAVLPSDGVGLARMEFIISESIKAHPLALLHPGKVTDAGMRAQLARLVHGYADGAEFFVGRLSEGIGPSPPRSGPNRWWCACRISNQRVRRSFGRTRLRTRRGQPDAGISGRVPIRPPRLRRRFRAGMRRDEAGA